MDEESNGPLDRLVSRFVTSQEHIPCGHDDVIGTEYVISVLIFGFLHGGDQCIRDVPDALRVKGCEMFIVFLLQNGVAAADQLLDETKLFAREDLWWQNREKIYIS